MLLLVANLEARDVVHSLISTVQIQAAIRQLAELSTAVRTGKLELTSDMSNATNKLTWRKVGGPIPSRSALLVEALIVAYLA